MYPAWCVYGFGFRFGEVNMNSVPSMPELKLKVGVFGWGIVGDQRKMGRRKGGGGGGGWELAWPCI